MQAISCPKCGTAFQVDEAGYADILKQVRDHEFTEALKARQAISGRAPWMRRRRSSQRGGPDVSFALSPPNHALSDARLEKDADGEGLQAFLGGIALPLSPIKDSHRLSSRIKGAIRVRTDACSRPGLGP